jgi:replicative DNA helicase
MNDLAPLATKGAEALRSAPHNAEAEAGLLGAILVNNEAFYRVVDFLEPHHFYLAPHQKIFATISELIRGGKVATPITVKTYFTADETIGEMSVPAYLLRLHADATSIINVVDYAGMVYELALRRMLIGIGEDMVNVAYDATVDTSAGAADRNSGKTAFLAGRKGSRRARLCWLRQCA